MEPKKKRGRKRKFQPTVPPASQFLSLPESDFEKFFKELNSDIIQSSEDSERQSLMFKITKLKLEIANLKDFKEIQQLRRVNNQLHMEVLKLRHQLLTNTQMGGPSGTVDSGSGGSRNSASNNNESINIKNVIYNNCGQNFATKSESEATKVKQTIPDKGYDPNFTCIASQILSYLSDKFDANVASHTESIKQYAHEILKAEFGSIKNDVKPPEKVTPIKIKIEKTDNSLSRVVQAPSLIKPTVAPQIPQIPRPETPPPKPPSPIHPALPPEKPKELNFSYNVIKPKILEYLSDKVDQYTIVSSIRRLTMAKAKSMTKQLLLDHTKLLRVYLFSDSNILVQDMMKCTGEFSRETYHSVRYYAVSLIQKPQEQNTPSNIPAQPTPEPKPTSSHSLRSKSDKLDYVVLQPSRDHSMRPRFRVESIQDMMICEDFELISSKPFSIRPLSCEVVLTSSQMELLRPLVLAAVGDRSRTSNILPVISISSNLQQPDEFNNDSTFREEERSKTDTFLIQQQTPSTSSKKVIDLTSNPSKLSMILKKEIDDFNTSFDTPINRNKIPDLFESHSTTPIESDSLFSIVNVEDIFNKAVKTEKPDDKTINAKPQLYHVKVSDSNPCVVTQLSPTHVTRKAAVEQDEPVCIDLDDDNDEEEDDDTILID